jgi:hypothetical protein
VADHVLKLLARAEILDQLRWRIRFTGVAMVVEPSTVVRSELPRIELTQVRKDFCFTCLSAALILPPPLARSS